jgi:hypothetical protein
MSIGGLELSAKQKAITRRLTSRAIGQGMLARKPCEICGSEESDVHHLDYTNPLAIQWLCTKHHGEAHRGQRRRIPHNHQRELRTMIDRWLHRWRDTTYDHYNSNKMDEMLWYRKKATT